MTNVMPPEPKTLKNDPAKIIRRYTDGAKRSQQRLRQLCFDPMEELVNKYRKLEEELDYHERVRDTTLVPLNANGNPIRYNAEAHMAVYDKLITVAEKLLRYGYGRVPETNYLEDRKPAPLVVNLTKKGDTYVVNDSPKEDFDNVD